MQLGTKIQTESAVPLHSAVLCIDCECVTNGLSDECLVCGSRSLFSLARMLGDTQISHPASRSKKTENVVRFDVEITIDMKQIESKELSATVEGIASLLEPSVGRGHASFHIDVEPVVHRGKADAARAA
jgi:hypothetical protein